MIKEILATIKETPFLSVGFISFLIVFSISPYSRGLFFYENRYIYFLIIFMLLILTLIFTWKSFHQVVNNNHVLVLVSLMMPLMYLISYLFFSVSKHFGMNEVVYWMASVSVFVYLLGVLHIQPKFKEWLWWACWVVITWIVGLAYMSHLDVLYYQDAIIWDRFASVFQYPNTFASLVSAFVLAALYLLVKEQNRTIWLIYSLMVLPFIISFLMTESRGGYLVFAVSWMIILFFLRVRDQFLFMIYSAFAGLISLITIILYQSTVAVSNNLLAGVLLFLGTIAYVLACIGVRSLLSKRGYLKQKEENSPNAAKFSFSRLLVPIIIILLAVGSFLIVNTNEVAFLPENIQERISDINLEQHSVQERILFYKDSTKIISDFPWLGAGGGAWRSLFETYKSLPYHSTQAHSFYMQTIMEVGIIGGIVVFLFFVLVLFQAIKTLRSYKKAHGKGHNKLTVFCIMLVTLMLHNFIDFNMSFATYFYFIMVILALIISEINDLNENFVFQLPKLTTDIISRVATFTLAIILIMTLLGGYKSYAFYRADGLLKQTGLGGGYSELEKMINTSINLDSANPRSRYNKIELLKFAKEHTGQASINEEIKKQYEKLLEIEPYDFRHYNSYSEFELENGNVSEAMGLLKKSIEIAPWISESYIRYIKMMLEYLVDHRGMLTEQERNAYLEELVSQLEKLDFQLSIQHTNIPKGLNLTNPMVFTNEEVILIGKALYFTGEFEKAYEFLTKNIVSAIEDDLMFIEYNIVVLLLLNAQGDHQEFERLLQTERAIKLDIRSIFEQSKLDKAWQPL